MSDSPKTPKMKKRGSIIADTKEKLASPKETPTKKSVDQGELKQLRRTSLVTRRSSDFKSGEIAKLALSPPPKSTPITDDEVEVLKNVKEQRAKEAELERQEKETEQETRRKSRVSEAQEEVAKGALDIKKEITRRSSEQFSPPPTDQAFKRQREVSAFAHALKRDSLIEDNLHGDQYKARKGELAAAHTTYKSAKEEKQKGGRGTVSLADGDEITLNSLDGAIKIKAKTSVGGPLGERKASENGGSDGQTPDWQKDGWNSDRKLTGKHGFLLTKGGSKRNENGRSVKLFTRHNWNTRFFMLNTSTKELSYFRNEVEPVPLGILKLEECTCQRVAHHVHTFVLELNGPNRKGFLLAATNTKELEDWEGAISSFCNSVE